MSQRGGVQKKLAGVVVSAGKMMKTVTVQMVKQEWNRKLRKNYQVPYKLLVNDPTDAVRTGDIVHLAPSRHSRHVMHTVAAIIAPFGEPLEERPALLSLEERTAIYEAMRARKAERKSQRETLLRWSSVGEGKMLNDGEVTVLGTSNGEGRLFWNGKEIATDALEERIAVYQQNLARKATGNPYGALALSSTALNQGETLEQRIAKYQEEYAARKSGMQAKRAERQKRLLQQNSETKEQKLGSEEELQQELSI